jgi:putative hydrolase of HD superfamily
VKRLDALLHLVPLEHLPRTGWIQRGIAQPESIAAHSLGAALIAVALGDEVEPALDTDRAVALLVVHDTPEAWLGDLPRAGSERLPAGAKREAEARIADELLGALSPRARAHFAEVSAGETREARFAKACDRLHLGLRLLAYLRSGRRGLDDFLEGLEAERFAEFAVCEELRAELVGACRAELARS